MERETDQNDLTISQRAIAGDKEAFGELYEKYYPKALNYFLKRTANYEDSEDLTGSMFLSALTHIETYQPGPSFGPWLFKIASHKLVDYYRSRGIRSELCIESFEHQLGGEDLEEEVLNQERSREVRKAVGELPGTQQEVIILHYYAGLNYQDIGSRLGISHTGAWTRARKGQKTIKHALSNV